MCHIASTVYCVQELERLTGLTELTIRQDDTYCAKCLLGSDLTRLSTLAALRSLALDGKLPGTPE